MTKPKQEPVKYKCTIVDDEHPDGVPLGKWGKPAQQEPVAWMMVNKTLTPTARCLYWKPQKDWHITWEAVPLYAAPKREWVTPKSRCNVRSRGES